jgi:hypothetical protein
MAQERVCFPTIVLCLQSIREIREIRGQNHFKGWHRDPARSRRSRRRVAAKRHKMDFDFGRASSLSGRVESTQDAMTFKGWQCRDAEGKQLRIVVNPNNIRLPGEGLSGFRDSHVFDLCVSAFPFHPRI